MIYKIVYILLFSFLLVSCQEKNVLCEKDSQGKCVPQQEDKDKNNAEFDLTKDCKDHKLKDGQSKIELKYQQSQVFNQDCKQIEVILTCEKGKIKDDLDQFGFRSCKENNSSCGELKHGEIIEKKRYKKNIVQFGDSCSNEAYNVTESCYRGILSRSGENVASYDSCREVAPRACGEVGHSSVRFIKKYNSSLVDFGLKCEEVIVKESCFNGDLSRDKDIANLVDSCRVKDPFNCQNVNHGSFRSIKKYKQSSVDFGLKCEEVFIKESCFNGTLSRDKDISNLVDSCSVKSPLNCENLKHGEVKTFTNYKRDLVSFGDQCESINVTESCLNGKLTKNTDVPTYSSCEVESPKSCGNIYHNETSIVEELNQETCNKSQTLTKCYNGLVTIETETLTDSQCIANKIKDPYYYLDKINKELSLRQIERVIYIDFEFYNFEDNSLGYYHNNKIYLNLFYWDKLSEMDRELVVFHEIGHGIFLRNHCNLMIPNTNLPVSMMNKYFMGVTIYKNNRKYYIDELFNPSECSL